MKAAEQKIRIRVTRDLPEQRWTRGMKIDTTQSELKSRNVPSDAYTVVGNLEDKPGSLPTPSQPAAATNGSTK